MRLSVKAKQVAGVTSIVGLAVVVLSGFYLTSLARMAVEDSAARAESLASTIYQRAQEVVAQGGDSYETLRADGGLRSILESNAYYKNFTYAALVNADGIVIAHSDAARIGQTLPQLPKLTTLVDQGAIAQLRAIYGREGRRFEVDRPLLLMDGSRFGSIRIGVSMLLTQDEVTKALKPALLTDLAAIIGATLVAMLLAQVLLRPIHVIRSGLTRLGRGESGVAVNLPQQDEFGDLGGFFNTVSAQLSADRSELAGQKANLESVVEHLEDAVAMFTPDGELLFANPAMRDALPPEPSDRTVSELLPPGHPYRNLVEDTLRSGQSCGPVSATVPRRAAAEPGSVGLSAAEGERLILTNVITDRDGRTVGIMLVARNLEYLGEVQSTLNYSRKLAALGRLSAGVAHEIKNPLNATMIHLELLKQRLSAPAGSPADGAAERRKAGPDVEAALGHAAIIAGEMRRLDLVVQGFLKFARPEDLKLQAVSLHSLVEHVVAVIAEEARNQGVEILIDCPTDLPALRGDPGMLEQAFLNLALNAVQAMPEGGRLRIAGAAVADSRVAVVFEDTGVGITPEHLGKIFDLYFTTKGAGSGIGLSVVYRTVQLHDGDIEVDSTPGRGTVFRLLLPRAQAPHVRTLLGS
ncbi:MAG: ATP-binding protein [Acidobacteria bacterium]|nr:ATP-binding protein [Acidobacteriota bacterium]